MTVTSRLSRKLHETFGNEAAEDLVDWMRGVDSQGSELRKLIELTVSRFEERMDRRVAELRQEMQVGFARLETMIERRSYELIKWSFVFWMGSVVTLVGALVAMDRFLK